MLIAANPFCGEFVVQEAGFVRTVVFDRVERLHDVVLASLTVLRRFWQAAEVHSRFLRPVLQVLLAGGPFRGFATQLKT
jgi:hypothetical protein